MCFQKEMAFRHLIEQLRSVHNLAGTTILDLVLSHYLGVSVDGVCISGFQQDFCGTIRAASETRAPLEL